jgi:acetyltransferase-like isoleucine patch superfamily enzyme
MSYMPYLYFTYTRNPDKHQWARDWQSHVQRKLTQVERVNIGEQCFIAPCAGLFGEPGREITVGNRSYIAAGAFLHGPITIGEGVSINHRTSMDGGQGGIRIGDNTRIAANCNIFAFNHGMSPDRPISAQPVSSRGVVIGCDVWIGANCGVVDGVEVGNHAVVGMNSVVTESVPAHAIVAGNPARQIGARRDKIVGS